MKSSIKHREQPGEKRAEQAAGDSGNNCRNYRDLVLISIVCGAVGAFLVNLVLFLFF